MSLGATVRRAMGPFEKPIANLYRGVFVNINDLANTIKQGVNNTSTSSSSDTLRILEIGGGEGAMTEQLLAKFPKATITSIDIAPTIGRLFDGDQSRVQFIQITVEDFAATQPDHFDLIIICDVLHHVPWELHNSILNTGLSILKSTGLFIIKDWENRRNPINALSYLLERYVTGDQVRYPTREELQQLITNTFGDNSIQNEQRIKPWKNNILFIIKPQHLKNNI